jgi:hypothetical protein
VSIVNVRFQTIVVTSLVAASALMLTACQASPPEPTETPQSSTVESVTPTPSETTPAGDYYPFAVECADLIPEDTIFEFNPNYVLDNSGAMASANSSDLVKAMEGTTCNCVNQSSQASLTISVAHLTSVSTQVLREQAAAAFTAVEVGSESGYFGTVAGSGVLQVFTQDDYWYTVAGPEVAGPDDISGITDQLNRFLAEQ